MFGIGKKERPQSLGEMINSPEAPKPMEHKVERTPAGDFRKLGDIRLMDTENKAKSAKETIKGWFSSLKKRTEPMTKYVRTGLRTGAAYLAASPEITSYARKRGAEIAGDAARATAGAISSGVEKMGRVNYDNVISMNLNAPTTAETKSGKLESLLVKLQELPAQASARFDKVMENARGKMEKLGSIQRLDLNISASVARSHQERDLEPQRQQFAETMNELQPSAKVEYVMDVASFQEMNAMAERLNVGYKFTGEIGPRPNPAEAARPAEQDEEMPLEKAA